LRKLLVVYVRAAVERKDFGKLIEACHAGKGLARVLVYELSVVQALFIVRAADLFVLYRGLDGVQTLGDVKAVLVLAAFDSRQ